MDIVNNYYFGVSRHAHPSIVLRVRVDELPDGPVVPNHGRRRKARGETILMATITATQHMVLGPVQFKNRKGGPATVDGPPEWFSDNTDVLTVEPTEDGLSCDCLAVGPAGTAKVTLRADAAPGQDVEVLMGTVDFTVTPGKATQVKIPEGPAEEQPEEQV